LRDATPPTYVTDCAAKRHKRQCSNYGLGVGRGLGVGITLGVGVAMGVAVATGVEVTVGVGVTVGTGVAVIVGVAVAEAVGVGVGVVSCTCNNVFKNAIAWSFTSFHKSKEC
jgi:hypothetical protein